MTDLIHNIVIYLFVLGVANIGLKTSLEIGSGVWSVIKYVVNTYFPKAKIQAGERAKTAYIGFLEGNYTRDEMISYITDEIEYHGYDAQDIKTVSVTKTKDNEVFIYIRRI